MDANTLVTNMVAEGQFTRGARLPGLTLGLAPRTYLGTTVLPVKIVAENMFYERGISYRTIMANTGTRYSPVTLERGVMVGGMRVELGEVDAGDEYTAADYDAFRALLGAQGDIAAQAELLQWSTRTLALPIQERIEKQRWEAIDDAQVIRKGNNGYLETVAYPNPSGHRIAGGSLTDAAADPIEILLGQQQLMGGKGYTVGRIITSLKVASQMAKHPLVRAAIGGEGRTSPVRITREILNGYLNDNGLPALEIYDLTARNADNTTVRFKRENALTMLAQTGRTAQVDLPDGLRILPDTLGYAAIGRAAGQQDSGVVVNVELRTKKPIGLEGESYATTAPVVTDPEAISVINYTL